MNLKSIRWKLPLTYAGIALITALVLGGTLLAILRYYYQEQELNYLRKNATAIASALSPFLFNETSGSYPVNDLKSHLALLAFLSQTRVRLLDPRGEMIVDFNFIGAQDPEVVLSAVSLPAVPAQGTSKDTFFYLRSSGLQPSETGALGVQIYQKVGNISDPQGSSFTQVQILKMTGDPSAGSSSAEKGLISVIPAVGTMFGFDLQGDVAARTARSTQVFRQNVLSPTGALLASVELSDGPSVGWDVVMGVARGWILASLAGIFIAALAGWWISRRMSMPLLALTDTTRRMAKGDLTVRVAPGQAAQRDEIGSLGLAFNEMADRVEGMVSTLKSFASDAAHELRTPLTALHTNLDLLTAETENPADPIMEEVWRQVERLEKLTGDLLDLSRLEMRMNDQDVAPVNLKALLEEVCEPYASRAEQAGIDFELELPGEPLNLPGHPIELGRAVANLLDNALKFTRPGGRITVGLCQDADSIKLWVADTGIGIPAEDLPYLFSRFHRGRNAAAYPGSGLGLAIVKAILDRHGGKIRLAPSTAAGACFEMTFGTGS